MGLAFSWLYLFLIKLKIKNKKSKLKKTKKRFDAFLFSISDLLKAISWKLKAAYYFSTFTPILLAVPATTFFACSNDLVLRSDIFSLAIFSI